MDNRPQSEVQKSLQRMKIRTANKASEVSGATHNKHVVAVENQATAAKAAYLHSTFVTSDNILTAVVDSNDHNFTELDGVASARYDFNADVNIYQWNKTEGPGADKPVTKDIDNVSTSCEIGVKKGGDEKLKITHFKKN